MSAVAAEAARRFKVSGHRAADGQPPLYAANVQAEVLATSEDEARII